MVKKQLTEFQQQPATEIVINAVAPLTHAEAEILSMYEETIMDGLHTFVKVGEALQKIRDGRLYRVNYASFEVYCQEKWGIGRQYAYRLIGGAEVAGNLVSSIGDTALPQKEAHTRELSKLAPEAQPVAWLKAVQAAGSVEAVTAEIVSRAVDEVLGKVGRFDPKLWYAVDEKQKLVYEPGAENYGGESGNPLREFNWVKGGELNLNKGYDGYQVAPVPTVNSEDIAEKLPNINIKAQMWGENVLYYPVNNRKRIIYNDPVPYEQRGEKRYPNCEFVREAELVRDWNGLKKRLFEYAIRPADPCIEWTSSANLQPGKFIRCHICHTEHSHADMVAGIHGEFWTCPQGNVIRDEKWTIRDAPTEQPTAPTTPAGTFDDEDEADDRLDPDIYDTLSELVGLSDILDFIFENLEDVALALKPEHVEAFNSEEEYEISPTALEWLNKMVESARATVRGESNGI